MLLFSKIWYGSQGYFVRKYSHVFLNLLAYLKLFHSLPCKLILESHWFSVSDICGFWQARSLCNYPSKWQHCLCDHIHHQSCPPVFKKLKFTFIVLVSLVSLFSDFPYFFSYWCFFVFIFWRWVASFENKTKSPWDSFVPPRQLVLSFY